MSDTVRSGFAATDDGEQLYYRAIGDGPPLVCCNGVGVSTFFWKYLVAHFKDRFTVVLWDYRGHGRSTLPADVDAADLSMPRNADDLITVLDEAGLDDPAVLVGHSMGCQVILEAHKRHHDRVRALVPMFGTYARPLDTFMDFKHSRAVFDLLHQAARNTSRSSRRLLLPLYASPLAFPFSRLTGLVDRYYATKTDIDRYTDHLGKMDTDVFLGMLLEMAEHDLTDHLPAVDVPTLVYGGERDLFTPVHRAEAMAHGIRDAELLILPGASHAAVVEQHETINARLDRFLQERLGLEPA